MKIDRASTIIVSPHISEKATNITGLLNQHVFHVRSDANKAEIKQAIETMFSVKVVSVNTSIVKGKRKRFGQIRGKRSDWKKAYVRLAEGQAINLGGLE